MLKANFRVRPTTKLAGFVLTGDSLDRRSTVFPFALNKLLSVSNKHNFDMISFPLIDQIARIFLMWSAVLQCPWFQANVFLHFRK